MRDTGIYNTVQLNRDGYTSLIQITIKSLVSFIGYHDVNNNKYYLRNVDLLSKGVTNNIHQYIVDVFSKVADLRNSLFHRDNLLDWNIVNEVRATARLSFYLFLGAYSFTNDDLDELGLVRSVKKDDYYLLCDYMNKKAMNKDHKEMDDNSDNIVFPIYYVDGSKDPYDYNLVKHDLHLEYDEYGDPVYSGFYFGEHEDKNVHKDKVPHEIWEGNCELASQLKLKLDLRTR